MKRIMNGRNGRLLIGPARNKRTVGSHIDMVSGGVLELNVSADCTVVGNTVTLSYDSGFLDALELNEMLPEVYPGSLIYPARPASVYADDGGGPADSTELQSAILTTKDIDGNDVDQFSVTDAYSEGNGASIQTDKYARPSIYRGMPYTIAQVRHRATFEIIFPAPPTGLYCILYLYPMVYTLPF